MAVSFSVNAMVRGSHVYQDIWDASFSEELPCQREPGNSHDPFAVAIVRACASFSEELPCQREPGNSHDPFAVAIVRA